MHHERKTSMAVKVATGAVAVTMLAGLAPSAAVAAPQAGAPQSMVSVARAVQLSDITGNAYEGQIRWLAENEIVQGWPDGTYRPLQSVNRDAMAAFLYRLAGKPEVTLPATSPFKDVRAGQQHYEAIVWLAQQKISTGWDNGDGTRSFRPLQPINRDAMAAFLYRYAGSPEYDAPGTPDFSDVAGNAFYDEIHWLADKGITTGWTKPGADPEYRPLTPIARDAMAAFLYRTANTHPEGPSLTIVESTGQTGKSLALTFDDGPDPTNTPALLDVLAEHQVKATFCLVGSEVEKHPDLVRQIVAEGHKLCNHSMTHAHYVEDLWTDAEIRTDLQQTNAAIVAAAPHAKVPYYRAPYGEWGNSPAIAASLGMASLGWGVDVNDWTTPPPTAAEVAERVEAAEEGDVVLLHDGGGDRTHTVTAVDQVIPQLKADGWSFDWPA